MDSATPRSTAGSISLRPPATLIIISCWDKGSPALLERTAAMIYSRFISMPLTVLLGSPKAVGWVKA
jgi:hypothetical protein